MTNIDVISNGNEKLSSRELKYLNKLAHSPNFVSRFSKEDLKHIEENLRKQLSAYLKRHISSASKKNIRELTYRAIVNIERVIWKQHTEKKEKWNETIDELEKEFPTIRSVEKLIKSIQKMKVTRRLIKRKLREISRNHYSDDTYVTLHYAWIRDKVTVRDLKWILKAINYSIKSSENWVIYSKHWEVNYDAVRKTAEKELEKVDTKWLKRMIALAQTYVWKTEANTFLRKEIKKYTHLDIRYEAWCAAFVRMMLIKSWYEKAAHHMNNAALSALWISRTWYHIWISIGGWMFIDWNSWKHVDKVTKDSIYRAYRKKWFVGRVMPENVWDRSKVNFWFPPPAWAIVVFARGKWYAEKAIRTRRELWLRWGINYRASYHKKSYRRTRRKQNPLDLLRA